MRSLPWILRGSNSLFGTLRVLVEGMCIGFQNRQMYDDALLSCLANI